MRPTLSLIRREFLAYFYSPIAYVVMAVLLAVTGGLFFLTVYFLDAGGPRGVEFPMRLMLGFGDLDPWLDLLIFLVFWLVFLILPPLLTMRLLAEERSAGTLEMLLTAPLRDWQVVVSKYLACLAFYVVMWLPTLLYLPIILGAATSQDSIDPRPVATAYLGLFLAGAMFLAMGMWISSLVKSQMVAFLVALFISLPFIVIGMLRPWLDTGSTLYGVLFFFSVPLHFQRDFSRGVIDTRHVVLYLSMTWFFLFLTVRSLESRQWR